MRHSGYVRNFESTLRMLCDRGHHVHLAFQGKVKYEQLDPTDVATQLATQYRTFSYGDMPLRVDGWGLVGRELRLALDYLRYLEPEYDNAPKLRERARREAPPWVLEREERGQFRSGAGRRVTAAWLRAQDRAIPRDAGIDAFVRKMKPDVLAVTPLIEPGSPQAEYLRSARACGVRTLYCVASWDNLTNKGLIHGPVDLVTVWNDAMKREAMTFHGVPERRIAVTGAAAFDHWFDWRPGTREAFCARVGLRADRPYLLYLCSSKFVAPEEVPFVRRWVHAIRGSNAAALREAGILVRPHPQNAEQWADVDLGHDTVIWPRAGAAPVDTDSRSDYFDSMYHSAAVVGVNTTAEIESAILGRGVYTVLAPEFRDTQEGTLHFHHLRQVNGGLLHVAGDLDEHLRHIETAVANPKAGEEQCRRFVNAFVRPYGVDVPATPRMVEAFETLARMPAHRGGEAPVWAGLLRARLAPRAADLEREAHTDPQSYAAKLGARSMKELKRRTRNVEREKRMKKESGRKADDHAAPTPGTSVTGRKHLDRLVGEFGSLDAEDRRTFLKAITDRIPPYSLIELNAYTAGKPRLLDYEHADILMRATTKAETFRLRACAKEPFTIEWIHSRIGAGEVLFDIGANVGAYSLVAAKKPGGGARVFSFEASYPNVAALTANVALNGLSGQVTPMPIALSGATAMNVFSLRDLDAGAARHALGDAPPEEGPVLVQQPVLMFRLDDLIEQFRLPQPNHIKLDVDGGELEVLAGASNTLASPTLRTMLVEVSTSLSGPVTEILERHGLRLESKTSVQNKAGEYAVWYGVFARESSPPAR